MDRFESLVCGYLEGTLDTAAAEELGGLLRNQLSLRKRFLVQTELQGLLWAAHAGAGRALSLEERLLKTLPGAGEAKQTEHDILNAVSLIGAEAPGAGPVASHPASYAPSPFKRRLSISPVWLAAAAVVLIFGPALYLFYAIVSGNFNPRQFAASARLDACSGKTVTLRASDELQMPAQPGDPLSPMTGIQTDGSATFSFRDGTTVTLNANALPARAWLRNKSPLALAHREASGGKRVTIDSGAASFDVAKQPADEPLIVITPHAEVQVVGTVFSVDVTNAITTVRVTSGTVQVTQVDGTAPVSVGAGMQISTEGGDSVGPAPLK
jgi:hypothetical protein